MSTKKSNYFIKRKNVKALAKSAMISLTYIIINMKNFISLC